MRRLLVAIVAAISATLIGGGARSARASIEVASNSSPITIPVTGAATPYPSTITISATGVITDVNVTLFGVTHTFIDDVGALLVGPGGQNVVLFNAPGEGTDISNLNWTFDDTASTGSPLPNSDPLLSGTFLPSNYIPGDNFPGAPVGPYGTTMSVFIGADLNGDWDLYIYDFSEIDEGEVSGGWSLTITYDEAVVPEPTSLLCWGGLALAGAWKSRRAWRA